LIAKFSGVHEFNLISVSKNITFCEIETTASSHFESVEDTQMTIKYYLSQTISSTQ